MSFFRKQLRSVIEWEAPVPGVLFEKHAADGDEIKNASTLIVAPGQGCIFIYEGAVKGVLTTPGSYPLETGNIPFVTTLLSFMNAFESKHKTALYFFRQTQIPNLYWGTADAVKYMDPEYKFPVKLRAFGNFTITVTDASLFYHHFIGGGTQFLARDAEEIINARITEPMAQILAQSAFAYHEIDSQRTAISALLTARLNEIVTPLGLQLTDFRVESTNFDEDTQAYIDKIVSVSADDYAAKRVDLSYAELQKLQALRDAARNETGMAGIGAGAGAGFVLAKELFAANTPQSATRSLEDRLVQLKNLYEKALITAQEYEHRKNEILKEV